jgi:hypothetical protein
MEEVWVVELRRRGGGEALRASGPELSDDGLGGTWRLESTHWEYGDEIRSTPRERQGRSRVMRCECRARKERSTPGSR